MRRLTRDVTSAVTSSGLPSAPALGGTVTVSCGGGPATEVPAGAVAAEGKEGEEGAPRGGVEEERAEGAVPAAAVAAARAAALLVAGGVESSAAEVAGRAATGTMATGM